MTAVLDTNVILHYLTNDHEEQSPRAYALFKQLEEGAATVLLTEAVLVEVVQALDSRRRYNLPRGDSPPSQRDPRTARRRDSAQAPLPARSISMWRRQRSRS